MTMTKIFENLKNKLKKIKSIKWTKDKVLWLSLGVVATVSITVLSSAIIFKIVNKNNNNLINSIELKDNKKVFTATELGLSDKTISEANSIVDTNWIFTNKDNIFSGAENMKESDITKLEKMEKNGTSLEILISIGNKNFMFYIVEFKMMLSARD